MDTPLYSSACQARQACRKKMLFVVMVAIQLCGERGELKNLKTCKTQDMYIIIGAGSFFSHFCTGKIIFSSRLCPVSRKIQYCIYIAVYLIKKIISLPLSHSLKTKCICHHHHSHLLYFYLQPSSSLLLNYLLL